MSTPLADAEMNTNSKAIGALTVILAAWFVWGFLDMTVKKFCETIVEVNKTTNTRETDLKLIRLELIENQCRAQHQLNLQQPRIYQYPQPVPQLPTPPTSYPGSTFYTPAEDADPANQPTPARPRPMRAPELAPGPIDEEAMPPDAPEGPTVRAPNIKTFSEPEKLEPSEVPLPVLDQDLTDKLNAAEEKATPQSRLKHRRK